MKRDMLIYLWIITITSLTFSKAATTTDESRLLETLLTNYSIDARPVITGSDQATVYLSMYMLKFHEINTLLQYISVVGYLSVEWTDPRFSWTPSDYGGVDYIAIDPARLWLPTIALGNIASGSPIDSNWYSLFKARVYSDGMVKWSPGGTFMANCQIEVTYFPFDSQICEFIFENWAYTGDKVNLTYASDATDGFLDYYDVKSGEWNVNSVNVIRRDRVIGNSSFPEVHFAMKCTRKPLFYVTNIILLSLLLALLVLMMFKLPPESGERISMGVTLLLSFSVFILLIDGTIPDVSVPLIIVYLICFMSLTTLGIAESVLILYCHHHMGSNRPPKWARFVVFQILSGCLCERKSPTVEPKEKQQEENKTAFGKYEKQIRGKGVLVSGEESEARQTEDECLSEERQNSDGSQNSLKEWQEMAVVIDKFCFWLFLGIFAFLMLVLLIIIPQAQPAKDIDDTLQWAGF